jgi:hypothetical protein
MNHRCRRALFVACHLRPYTTAGNSRVHHGADFVPRTSFYRTTWVAKGRAGAKRGVLVTVSVSDGGPKEGPSCWPWLRSK